MRSVTIWSEGTRLAADLYYPPDFRDDGSCPAVVLCHGWGGTKAGLQRYAERFAAAGYVALAFDYRGWGESDGRVVALDDLPKERTTTTARVQVIREVVDPYDELWDVRHALDFIQGEPGVDASRIGLWGSSFGGGLVLWTAAHDDRVACVVSQVGAMGSLQDPAARDEMRRTAVLEARGELAPIPQDSDEGRGLRGTPHRSKMYTWTPVESAERVRAPVLLIDAEHEELFNRHEHSERVYERMSAAGNAPVEYRVVEGITHYQIYGDSFDVGVGFAVDWFDRYLGARS